ncbi:hypothetical protein [Desulfuromonas sp. AOP6]|uniref:hypothetical protein n=1 Tax=Desulfuromonas sp. AOP6 TaxID=1566351 RepID=UPI00128330C2|nr:hypothetical protein [Desulfuromonas sp. AOP6]BCA80176.1 hypothetical protein AOP6_1963 [Desulfuromonas sp. AOP6]
MNKKNLLMLLLALLGLSIAYAIIQYPRQQKIAQGEAPVRAAKSHLSASAATDPDHVQLDLLTPAAEPFPAPKKDLFGPLYRPMAPAPTPATRPQVKAPSPSPPPPPPVQEPLAPLPRFTVLGSLEKGGDKQVFLSLGSELYLVRLGSRFGPGEKFNVVDMTDRQLNIRMTGEDRLITLPLADKNAGKPLGIKRKVSAPLRESLPATADPVEMTLPDSPTPQESPAEVPNESGSVPYLKMPE